MRSIPTLERISGRLEMVYLKSLIVFVSEKVGCTIVLGGAMYFVYLQAKHNPSYSASFFGITRRLICKC